EAAVGEHLKMLFDGQREVADAESRQMVLHRGRASALADLKVRPDLLCDLTTFVRGWLDVLKGYEQAAPSEQLTAVSRRRRSPGGFHVVMSLDRRDDIHRFGRLE